MAKLHPELTGRTSSAWSYSTDGPLDITCVSDSSYSGDLDHDEVDIEHLAIRLVAQNPCSSQADIRQMMKDEISGRIRERYVPPNMKNLTDA